MVKLLGILSLVKCGMNFILVNYQLYDFGEVSECLVLVFLFVGYRFFEN